MPAADMESVISAALGDEHTYIFSSLFGGCKSLPSTSSRVRQLEVFAYGTCDDYRSASPPLPALTPLQARKLQVLTLTSVAAANSRLSLTDLRAVLSLEGFLVSSADHVNVLPACSTARYGQATDDPDSILREALQRGFVAGRIDHLRDTFFVTSVDLARDARREAVGAMIETLERWRERCDEVLGEGQLGLYYNREVDEMGG